MTTAQQLGSRATTKPDYSWRDSAACRNVNAEFFFPVGSASGAQDMIDNAKAVCQACPVGRACLEYALNTNQEAGIWGGLAEDERRRLRRVWLANRRRHAR